MWHVWEEDNTGEGVSYFYSSRREARAHVRRVHNNMFLSGWLCRGYNIETYSEL
jgi:hypothetical protein